MRNILLLSITLLTGLIMSCNGGGVACTEEFRTVGITVTGNDLTDHYTIRETTSDTIRHNNNGGFSDDYYIVLDDNYQSAFAGKQESFRFIGKIGSITMVNERFIIKADQCHISYVSGNTEVVL